jgi:dienelactone hydrolase
VDFATEAVPSSAAYNVAYGDQALNLPTRTTLSDGVTVDDFNDDGKPDVAQTNVIAGSVSIFLGDGRGGFAPPDLYPVGGHPQFVVAGRVDGDRHLDLAVANTGSSDIAILRGVGDGTFLPALFAPTPIPRNVAIGDFNGDDVADLAVASVGPGRPGSAPIGGVAILTGDGRGTFATTQLIQPTHSDTNEPVGANFVAAGDFNGGGFDDIAVGVGNRRSAGDPIAGSSKLTGDDVLIFLNRNETGDAPALEPFGTTPDQPAIRVGGTPDAIAVSHFNGDLHPDLAVMSNVSGDLTTLLGDRRGRFVVAANNVTVGGQPRALAVGDFNDDSIGDLVAANWHGSTVSVLQGNVDRNGNGDGTFQPAVDFWSGDATTSVAVGDFDGDRRLDLVAARLQDDELALLRNDSPKRGDGVVITRDISYISPRHRGDDFFAAHHALDVYEPPAGTPSLNGRGRPYPVAIFVHGGAGVSGDKTMSTYLMRSLALEGIVVVAIDYRLADTPRDPAGGDAQTGDVQQAFRWVREHIGSSAYGGDPERIFVFGHSAGAFLTAKFGTEPDTWTEQKHIRGFVLVSYCGQDVAPTATQRVSLLIAGEREAGCDVHMSLWVQRAEAAGAQSDHLVVPNRDHMTILADMALAGDPAREAMLDFMRDLGTRGPRGEDPSDDAQSGAPLVPIGQATDMSTPDTKRSLPATGGGGTTVLAGAAVCLLAAALRGRPASS